MRKRPSAVPEFATNPSVGRVVEPTEAVRTAGFADEDQPPASWINWELNVHGQWFNFLRSFDPSNMRRWTVTPTFLRLGVDNVTADGGVALHRALAVGGALDTHLWSSVTGETWLQLTLNSATAFGIPICTTFGGYRWFVGTGTTIAGPYSGTGKIWCTFAEGNPGYGVSSVGDDTQNWTACTVPGGTTDVRAICEGTHPVYGLHIVAVTNTAILWNAFTGGSAPYTVGAFFAGTLSAVVTASALFCDVIYSGSSAHTGQWVAVTTKGDVYTAADPSGTWTKNATNLGIHPWRLATDGLGTVAAYFTNSSSGSSFFVSADDGATWPAGTAPPFSGLTEIRYLDGSWFCTTTGFAPYLAESLDLSSGSWLRIPTPYVEGETMDLGAMALLQGAMVVTGSAVVLVSKRASDVSPAAYSPGNTPAELRDAAYIRGYEVHNTAPQDGDTLVWDAANSRWDPGVDPYVQTAVSLPITTHTRIVGVTSTAAARTITLNSAVRAGTVVTVYDESNAAGGAHPITIATTSGNIYLNGVSAATQSIATNGGSLSFYFDGTDWRAF